MIASFFFVLGVALVVAGIAQIFVPAAFIAAGAVVAGVAWLWETRNPGVDA